MCKSLSFLNFFFNFYFFQCLSLLGAGDECSRVPKAIHTRISSKFTDTVSHVPRNFCFICPNGQDFVHVVNGSHVPCRQKSLSISLTFEGMAHEPRSCFARWFQTCQLQWNHSRATIIIIIIIKWTRKHKINNWQINFLNALLIMAEEYDITPVISFLFR